MNCSALFQIILLKLERLAQRVSLMAEELLQVKRVDQEIINSKNTNIKSQNSLISWSVLPADLLHLVSVRLHLCDHINFQGVCVTWRAAASVKRFDRFDQCSLFILHDLHFDNNNCSVICPFHGRRYEFNLPGCYKKYRCLNSSHGWLFMVKRCPKDEIFLLNPFTGARVDLPRCDRFIHRVLLSSAPTDPNCTVIIFEQAFSGFRFCRVGDDEWQLETFSPAILMNALLFKRRKLYLLCKPGFYLSHAEATIAAANTATPFKLEFLRIPYYPSWTNSKRLVESGEEILLVIRSNHIGFPYWCSDISVFKLDMRTSSWTRMKRIGNRVLFLGHWYFGDYSASFNATEIGCKENQIYFQCFERPHHTWWVFNMEDKSIKPASSDSSFSLWLSTVGLIGITPSLV